MPDFPRTAFLLGAGLGTRLRPLTENCPKPLLPIGGRPMVLQAMEKLRAAGTRRFLINTHHRPEAWALAFPDGRFGDAEVKLVHEPVLLETGGGLANIAGLLDEEDADLVVWNGDILSSCDIAAAVAHHRANGGAATLVVREQGPNRNVRITDEGFVTDLRDRGLVAAVGRILQGSAWQRSSVNICSGGMFPLVRLRHRERTLAA